MVLDRASLSNLPGVKERVELCDESGHVVGYVSPKVDRSLYEGVEAPFSEEELQRAEREPETSTTAEILAYSKSLEKP
jgi:hypothetical protein